jgi:beta-carotene ketolase (CrtW type)
MNPQAATATGAPKRLPTGLQTTIGLSLAAAVAAAWLALHIYGVFFFRLSAGAAPLAAGMVLLECWLGAGLFIIAHDAMHGSLAPGRPRLNRLVGQAALGIYAGFDFNKLNAKHHEHHGAPGTADDPDFHAQQPRSFWRWYGRFFSTYFGKAEFTRLTLGLLVYLLVFRVHPLNAAVFWGLPALLSSLQLFTFGTFLPHRQSDADFADRHRARTLDYPWILSLAACFHFGLHHEHHLRPGEPWWRLPKVRRWLKPTGAVST